MLTRHDTNNLDTGADPTSLAPSGESERHARRSPYRRAAMAVGALYIAGDIAGVLGRTVTSGLFKEPDYLSRIAAHQNRLVIGALCVLAMGLFLAAIPMVMYPIFRKHNPVLATGYVVVRGALETVTYIALATAWLLLVALSRDYATSGSHDAAPFATVGRLLIKAQGSIGPDMTAIVFSLGALTFAYLLYRTRLVPRWLSIWGLAGAVAYLAAPLLSLFDHSTGILMAPLAVQEIVLAVWLIARGFDATSVPTTTALTSERVRDVS